MTTLGVYRDDGAIAQWVAARADGERRGSAVAWVGPPVVRLAEYGFLIGVTAAFAPSARPACFALLFVLAYHHYDNVHRISHQGAPPPRWLLAAGGGWEGRIALAAVLSAAGVLGPGLLVTAIALGLLFFGESAVSWIRWARAPGVGRTSDDAFE